MRCLHFAAAVFLTIIGGVVTAVADSPYPIVLVHGLDSSSDMWEDSGLVQYMNDRGWTPGGVVNFTFDQDDEISNVTLGPVLYVNSSGQPYGDSGGDVWRVNFESEIEVSSNCAAIYLQAEAVRIAVDYITDVTDKEKVILIGHSMGGLASYAYIAGGLDQIIGPDSFVTPRRSPSC